MSRKIRMMLITVLLIAGMAASVIAADTVNGKVVKITGNKITVALQGVVPPWIKAGATVTAGNAAPRILSVKGNEVVLRFSKAKAAKIKVDSTITLGESSGDDVQGC